MGSFKEKVVLVTGGSLGIGRAMAEEFARNGAKVIICSRTLSDLGKASEDIKSRHGFCDSIAADVSSRDSVKELFDYVGKKHGRLDVLVNCAGVLGPVAPLESADADAWEKTIGINLIGTVNCVRHAIPIMKRQGHGKIINLAGGGVGSPGITPNVSAYISSKMAVAGFTEAVSKELKQFNIQVNAISPSPVDTRMLEQVQKARKLAGEAILKGATPEKAVALAVYLASDESFVTGKVISAVWDDYSRFDEIKDKLENTSLYNFRRIDDIIFVEKDKS